MMRFSGLWGHMRIIILEHGSRARLPALLRSVRRVPLLSQKTVDLIMLPYSERQGKIHCSGMLDRYIRRRSRRFK